VEKIEKKGKIRYVEGTGWQAKIGEIWYDLFYLRSGIVECINESERSQLDAALTAFQMISWTSANEFINSDGIDIVVSLNFTGL